MFNGLQVHVMPNALGRGRLRAITQQLTKHKASLVNNPGWPALTHILVEEDVPQDTIEVALNGCWPGVDVKVLRLSWLFACISAKRLVDETAHKVQLKKQTDKSSAAADKTTDKETKDSNDKPTDEKKTDEPEKKRARFVCETAAEPRPESTTTESTSEEAASSEEKKKLDDGLTNNQRIIRELKTLAEGYAAINDKWRALVYDKAIKQIQHFPREILHKEDVAQLRGIGKKIADKIEEIISSGHLRKADKMKNDEKVQTMVLFNNIWGVGPSTADGWYAKGLRTLDDVRTQAKLNSQQQIGLKHYDEFLERMQRDEAQKIAETVLSAARELVHGVECQACGSYRRGKQTCGDVDIIVTHQDGSSHECLPALVDALTKAGFLTDHLVHCSKDGNQHKYMGVCKLPGDDTKHRRLDIITVPYSEYATSLIYFTGSAHFTRSIYAKAKSMGMKLNQHGLFAGVMRQGGEKLNQGRLIETPTEESVFKELGLDYRTPAERDHP